MTYIRISYLFKVLLMKENMDKNQNYKYFCHDDYYYELTNSYIVHYSLNYNKYNNLRKSLLINRYYLNYLIEKKVLKKKKN